MTTIIIKSDTLINQIELSGHTGYADSGKDIVCAGLTTATFTTINLLDRFNQKFDLVTNEADGYLRLSLDYQESNEELKNLIQVILQNLIDTYEGISSDYPKYVKINR